MNKYSWFAMDLLTSLILVFFSLILCLYSTLKRAHTNFRKHGIPHLPPLNIFTTFTETLLVKRHLNLIFRDVYKQLEPHKFGGIYFLCKPMIMIRDPELIKQILVKDFDHFHDRGMPVNVEVEPLSNHLFSMAGEEWKNLRIKLTCTFTTGKMKMMFPLMKTCAEGLSNLLGRTTGAFDIKDFSTRYATDVIGSCTFGFDAHSLEDPDTQFRKMVKRIFQIRYRTILRHLFPNIPNRIIKIFGLQLFEREVADYFSNLVKDTIKFREDNHITRFDFLDLLIALKNDTIKESFHDNDNKDVENFIAQTGGKQSKINIDMTVELMAAQCILFFGAGFETSANTISFLMFELAQNEDIQNKVREEIISAIEDNEGELTYDSLRNMRYLDMVLAETLRIYSPSGLLTRECTIQYKIPGTDTILPKKTSINIPICGLHMDEKYYEKPNEFYPEHFTEEAKSQRPSFTYLPFGDGPRICIAERFAKIQIKVAVAQMIKNYSFTLSPELKLPLKFKRHYGSFQSEGAIFLEHQRL